MTKHAPNHMYQGEPLSRGRRVNVESSGRIAIRPHRGPDCVVYVMSLDSAVELANEILHTTRTVARTETIRVMDHGAVTREITIPCAPRHTCIIQPNPMPHDMGGSS